MGDEERPLPRGKSALALTMKQPSDMEGRVADHAKGLGTVTREMVSARARELAMINGHADRVLESDWEQARQELLGRTDAAEAEENATTEVPASENWDPIPGTTGHQVNAQRPDDEQQVADQLIRQGVDDAEHDQMVRATRNSLLKDGE